MNRAHLLKENEFLRNTSGTKDASWGRWALSIPEDDWARLIVANPDLNSKDSTTKTRAMMKFINSPFSLPYRVTDKI
jgi:hypothetical protein